jgi:hypothetical protein
MYLYSNEVEAGMSVRVISDEFVDRLLIIGGKGEKRLDGEDVVENREEVEWESGNVEGEGEVEIEEDRGKDLLIVADQIG